MPTAKYRSARAAARAAGVSANSIAGWQGKGWLGEPPWTTGQLTRAKSKSRQATPGPRSPHGSTSRYRAGCDCDLCNQARNTADRTRRGHHAQQRWAEVGPPLLEALRSGENYTDSLARVGVTAQAVTAHRRRSPDFAAELDTALTDGRDPTLDHGTAGAWRRRCRCPECRNHHEAERDPQRELKPAKPRNS